MADAGRALLLAGASAALACARGSDGGGHAGLLAADSAAAGAVVEAMAPDAWYLAPHRPALQGRGVRDALRADVPEGRVERRPLLAGLSSDGRHGYTAGRILEHAAVGTGDLHQKYLAYWRRDDSAGAWRIAAYVVNPSQPAPDSAPAPAVRAHRDPPRPGGGAGTPAALAAADSAFSARAGVDGAGTAFRAFAEPHAVLLFGGEHWMVWGDGAIGAAIGQAIPATDRLTWRPRAAQVAPSGDLGFTVGDAVYRSGGDGARSYTKYLTVWRRQADGTWRYAADAGNAQPAPTTELRVEPVADGLRLVNPGVDDVFFTVFEQATTALVNWRPCVDRDGCRFVPGAGERLVPRDSIPGYTPAADSATVSWWGAGGAGAAQSFDSVRSVTVALRVR